MAENWTEFVIGIIMIASPWVLGFSDISLAKWCNVLIGLLLILMSAWTRFGGSEGVVPVTDESQKTKKKTKNNNVE
ncbi:MAG TPA: SPW repeat protein [Candidatus Paceibacterota bacterium]